MIDFHFNSIKNSNIKILVTKWYQKYVPLTPKNEERSSFLAVTNNMVEDSFTIFASEEKLRKLKATELPLRCHSSCIFASFSYLFYNFITISSLYDNTLATK